MNSQQIYVDFGADKEYIISGLSSDINTVECVYDLIDNSIDAARDVIYRDDKVSVDQHGLPQSYSGFEIKLFVTESSFVIEDNCSGLEEDALANKSFKMGARSHRKFGIGHFGVGLNRAVFKFGAHAELISDNGTSQFTLSIDEDLLRASKDLKLLGKKIPSNKKIRYRLEVSRLRPGIASEFEDERWCKDLIRLVSQRYGIFLRKKLSITINGTTVPKFGPKLRRDNSMPPIKDRRVLSNGVAFYSEAGLHSKYEFSYESTDSYSNNRLLTPEYGWYIVCNDRIILVSDASVLTGWSSKWHNEYSGFVGWAYYVSEDPSLLPWNSKKTGIDDQALAHRETVSLLKASADAFKRENRLRIKASKKSTSSQGNSQSGVASPNHPASSQDSKKEDDDNNKPVQGGPPKRPPRIKKLDLIKEQANCADSKFTIGNFHAIEFLFRAAIVDYLKNIKKFDGILSEVAKQVKSQPKDVKFIDFAESLLSRSELFPFLAPNVLSLGLKVYKKFSLKYISPDFGLLRLPIVNDVQVMRRALMPIIINIIK